MAERLIRLPCPPILDELRARHHAVIEASAGTGKTFTLEHLFIDLLLGDGVRPPMGASEILLVTFTEKAAREIKSRCRALLTRIVELARTPMNTGNTPDAFDACPGHCACASPGDPCPCHLDERRCWTLDRQAIERFERALLDFDSVNISTIHAFCLRTLQEEAFQRGALFREELTDADALFDRVFRRCLRREFALGCRNKSVIGRKIAVCIKPKNQRMNTARRISANIEIRMVCEVQHGRLVGCRFVAKR